MPSKDILRVAKSSRDIESFYIQEKTKIDRTIATLEKQRLRDYIYLTNKRKGELLFRKNKLQELENSLNSHIRNLSTKMAELRKQKQKQKLHFDRLYTLNEHLKNMEVQVRNIDDSRKILLNNERKLLADIKAFFRENKGEFTKDNVVLKKITGVLDKKSKILAETTHLLGQDAATLFADKRILERMTDQQLNKVYNLNKQLKELRNKHQRLLQKRQLLKADDFKFEQEVGKISKQREELVSQLKQLGAR